MKRELPKRRRGESYKAWFERQVQELRRRDLACTHEQTRVVEHDPSQVRGLAIEGDTEIRCSMGHLVGFVQ